MMAQTTETIPIGYKKTEIGIIPDDWEARQLGKIAHIIMGQSPRSEFYNLKGIGLPLIQGNADVEKRKTIKRVYTSFVTKKGLCGNIIMSVRAPVGEISKATFDCCLGRGVCSIEFKNDYLYYFLINYEKNWTKLSKGSTFDSVNSKEVNEITIIFPREEREQIAIATVLSDTDTLIESLEKLIAKKKAIKQGAMQQLLTGKKRLTGFSGEWEVKRLNELFTITAGRDLIKEKFSKIKDDDHLFPIYSNSLENKGLYGYSQDARYSKNSITITARGTIGHANARNHKFDAIGRLLVLMPKKGLNCIFITEYLNNRVFFSVESTGVPQLTAPQASKYLVIYPHPDEQIAIANILSDMDAEIEKLEQKKDKYILLKQGMMQQLLTGKIRLVKKDDE